MPLSPVAVVGAFYTASERGLAADVLCARALGLAPLPVCTSIVVASGGRVTDVTEVPVDTVHAQLEHLRGSGSITGVKIGILGSPKTAIAVLDVARDLGGPVVLDLVASGPSGETVLSARGIGAVADRLGAADLVTLSRADAELVTGGEIASLDDAQVAAQRVHNRGARAVVIRCGQMPYRFYDAADDPGQSADGPLWADLYYDGADFALYEAPVLDASPDGAGSAFALAVLAGLIDGQPAEQALQHAKRFATDAVRRAVAITDSDPRIGVEVSAPEPSMQRASGTAP